MKKVVFGLTSGNKITTFMDSATCDEAVAKIGNGDTIYVVSEDELDGMLIFAKHIESIRISNIEEVVK